MASIVKRKSKYSVVYNIVDENGVKRQRWETFASQAEAKKRKAQIEYQQSTGTFIAADSKDDPGTFGGIHQYLRHQHLGAVHL